MATEDDDYDGDPLSGGSFTQLLESDDVGQGPSVEGGLFRPSTPSYDRSHAKMLCFGYEGEIGFFEAAGVQLVVGQKTGMSAGNSCSTSSSSGLSKSRKAGKAGGGGKMEEKGGVLSGSDVCATAESSRNAVKKAKTKPTCSSSSSSTHHRPAKAKKEKLGERITALQKLVSPYGKTDTASVLHEAMGYIRFLHDQVQVLSSPYLQRVPSSSAKLQKAEEEEGGEVESRCDLRSRGLCLVPVECTVHVARSNGADLWSPAMATNPSNR